MTSTPHRPGVRRKDDVQDADERERLPSIEAEQNAGNLARRQIHRRHDHAVEEQAEIHRAEAAHDRRGFAGVADLVELEIGQDARPAPQARVEEDRRDAREHERPPHPVARDAVAPDDVRDQIRRVAAERRRHHRQTGEPPGHGAARREELRRALAGAPAEEQRGHETDQKRQRDDEPVEGARVTRGNPNTEKTRIYCRFAADLLPLCRLLPATCDQMLKHVLPDIL